MRRCDKLAFMEVGNEKTPTRMRGFTEFSVSKNPKEYNRQYVDEETERNDVVGYAPSISYSFDGFEEDAVQKEIRDITDNELTGAGAIRAIIIVDMTASVGDTSSFKAVKRNYAVVPDSEGGETDAYTYSGNMKANGERITGKATSTDGWLTCTFTEDE